MPILRSVARGSSLTAAAAVLLIACTAAPSVEPSSTGTAASTPDEPGGSIPGSTNPPLPTGPDHLRLERVVEGLADPINIANARDGSGRLFINEQAGVIRVIESDGTLRAQPFVDLTDRVQSGGERGLLGLAFHPDFATNRRLFVHYSRLADGATVLSELTAAPDGQSADPDSERVLLVVDQPYANHNGGQLAFGPDGFLYLGLGDGGSGGDPQGNGQNMGTMLGKILRIDVDGSRAAGEQYAIPAGNPFVGGGALPEIWAYGLRNPWRFSFDRVYGDLYIADVGQGSWEEIDRQPGDSPGGENYGWNVMEGRHCSSPGCDQAGLVKPIAEYDHSLGCSVTGGYVYRGSLQPDLAGIYVFADLCSGRLFTLHVDEGTITPKEVLQQPIRISSFGEDEAGEIYLVDLGGGLYRVVVDG
ncbi:MAG: PQQ-dependent sugar dehydrogenase [Chloroflexota bacterium]|nr:PQQ-dependent sugar dehydrogenase [Chloroflexota bacterium]